MKTQNKKTLKTKTRKLRRSLLIASVPIIGLLIFMAAGLPNKAETESASGMEEGEPVASGSIAVTVKYKGTAPKPAAYKVTQDQSACHSTVENETLIVGSGNGIKNTMVYVKGATGTAVPKDYVLDNISCKFVPHAGFAHKGSKLVMKNSDAVMHNTHAYFVVGKMKKTIVNSALPKKGSTIKNSKALSKPGLITVVCDAHEWMSATIIVVDNPYYGVTDASGKTTIKNVPAGTYDVVFHHETLGDVTKKVTVGAGKTASVTVEMSK